MCSGEQVRATTATGRPDRPADWRGLVYSLGTSHRYALCAWQDEPDAEDPEDAEVPGVATPAQAGARRPALRSRPRRSAGASRWTSGSSWPSGVGTVLSVVIMPGARTGASSCSDSFSQATPRWRLHWEALAIFGSWQSTRRTAWTRTRSNSRSMLPALRSSRYGGCVNEPADSDKPRACRYLDPGCLQPAPSGKYSCATSSYALASSHSRQGRVADVLHAAFRPRQDPVASRGAPELFLTGIPAQGGVGVEVAHHSGLLDAERVGLPFQHDSFCHNGDSGSRRPLPSWCPASPDHTGRHGAWPSGGLGGGAYSGRSRRGRGA